MILRSSRATSTRSYFNSPLVWRLYKSPAILKKMYPGLIWDIKTQAKELYLTFDDGPVPDLTPFFLKTLKDFEAKATFFCVGDNVRKYPEIFEQILEDGHATGNHTFNHMKAWRVDAGTYLDNVKKCDEIMEMTGAKPEGLFRPPYGQMTRELGKILKKTHNIIMWDVLSWDFDASPSAKMGLSRTIAATRPGSIIVFHDNYKAESKVRYMLPGFLEHFAKQGYMFKSLAGLNSSADRF